MNHTTAVNGEKILVNADGTCQTPNNPIIPFIEGDGIGADITPVMRRVIDAAVQIAYDNARKISWLEIYAGEKRQNDTPTTGCPTKLCAPWKSMSSPLKVR